MEPEASHGPARRLGHAACLLLALALPACALPRSPTMAAVPPECRQGNPFGPEANTARACGLIPPCASSERTPEWTAFAQFYVQTGDILFRRGRSCTLAGHLTSMVLAGANDGRFSHDGLAVWEGDQLWVLDVEREGARKVPFELWMLDVDGDAFAVKRLRPEYRACIPAAVAFCESAYQRHVEFNYSLRPHEGRFYCSEMVETAYRSAGICLSEPVPICQLPGFQRYCFAVPGAWMCLGVNCKHPVFALGNEHYGTFGSPFLETVYEGPERDRPKRRRPGPERS